MSGALEGVTAILLLGGVFFSLTAAIGLLRLPDVYLRLHATAKTTTLGVAGVMLAILLHFGTYEVATKVLVVTLFFFLTSPIGAHMIGRSAYICAVGWCNETIRYDLERATIVCATRGGPESEHVQQSAIELARECHGRLIFLHVVDTTALEGMPAPRANFLIHQMRSLAEYTLKAAQTQAQSVGLRAHSELREGEVAQAIHDFIRQVNADVLVVGYPHTRSGHEHEAEGRLWRFLEELQERDNIRLVIAR